MKNNEFSTGINKRALKKSTLSIVFTVVFVVAVVLFNVIVDTLAEFYPINIDLTANKDYTMDFEAEHENFIKNIDNKVRIAVCAPKDDFDSTAYATELAYALGLTDCVTGSLGELTKKYALQTGVFIDAFESMNRNISISYHNINSVTSFRSIQDKFPEEKFEYGDIIVYCDHTLESGETYTRHQVLKMTDLFNLEQNEEYYTYYQYGYMSEPYYNTIKNSKLANAMTSAFYVVNSTESVGVAVIGGHDESIDTAGLEKLLKKNNYSFAKIENLVSQELPVEAKFVIVPAPTIDYTEPEIKKLSNYLKTGNKTLVYLPSVQQRELPLMEEFLLEWGIDVNYSMVMDTEATGTNSYYLYAENAGSEYTKMFEGSDISYYPSVYRTIKTTESTDATITSILTSGTGTAAYPLDAQRAEQFDINKAEKGPFDLALLSTMDIIEANAKSNILVVAGDMFFAPTDMLFGGAVGVLENASYANAQFAVNLFNSLSGNSTVEVTITEKTITELSFAEKISQNEGYVTIVKIVFMVALPLILVVGSVVIFIVRKRK